MRNEKRVALVLPNSVKSHLSKQYRRQKSLYSKPSADGPTLGRPWNINKEKKSTHPHN
jgi:hypothetical protein